MPVSPATLPRHNIQKTSTEIINYSIDFKDVLKAAVGTPTLSMVSHAVTEIPDGTPVSGIVPSSGVNGTTIEFQTTNGVDNTEYLLTFTVTLSDGQVLVECAKLLIKDC